MSKKHYKKGRYAFAVSAAGSATALTGGTSGTGISGGAVLNTKLSSAEQFDRVVAVTEPVTPTVQPTVNEGNTATTKPTAVVNPELVNTAATPGKQETGDVTPAIEPVTIPDEPAELAAQKSGNWKKWVLLAGAAGVLFLLLRKK